MATQTVTAMFETRAEAERAAEALRSQMSVLPGAIHVVDQASDTGVVDTANTNRDEDKGFFGSIKSLFLPDEDSHSYTEGVRRGDVLVSATIEHDQAGRAMDILEQHGALDYDSREQSWRAGGWQGYDQTTATTTAVPVAAATMATTTSATTPVAATATTATAGNNEAIPLYPGAPPGEPRRPARRGRVPRAHHRGDRDERGSGRRQGRPRPRGDRAP